MGAFVGHTQQHPPPGEIPMSVEIRDMLLPGMGGGGGRLFGSGRQPPPPTNGWLEPPLGEGGLVWFGSTPPRSDQAHGPRNCPCMTRLGWALPAIAVSRRTGLLAAPEPRGGTHGREIPPCLCVWRAYCWAAFGSWGGGGACMWGGLLPGAPAAGRQAGRQAVGA